MINIDRKEAVLLRILSSFFGKERVVPHMSLMAVCGGGLPSNLASSVHEEIEQSSRKKADEWARENKCLFTILNEDDEPRMVIEFVADFDRTIDVEVLNRQQYMRPMLRAAGIVFLTVTEEDFRCLIDPSIEYDVMAFLKEKVDPEDLLQKTG